MQLGLNQNISYKGDVYHVQTEDGGVKNPFITSILFKEGIILASRKTTYADIVKSDKLDLVVKDIMKEQHNQLIKELMSGRFEKGGAAAAPAPAPAPAQVKTAPAPAAVKPAPPAPQPAQRPAAPAPPAAPKQAPAPAAKKESIDDIIMKNLSLDEKKP